MLTSHALFLKEKFGAFEVGTKAMPTPGPGDILVKEVAVGLNPIDWKIQAYGIMETEFPAILGRDAAGQVEAVGEGVTQFKKGDKVYAGWADRRVISDLFLDFTRVCQVITELSRSTSLHPPRSSVG